MSLFGLDLSESDGSDDEQNVSIAEVLARGAAKTPKMTHQKTPLGNVSQKSKKVFSLFQKQETPKRSISSGESSSAKPKSRSKRIKIDSQDNQQILDFGQKDFGPRTCPTCKMYYEPKHGEDARRHNTFHEEYLERFKPVQTEALPIDNTQTQSPAGEDENAENTAPKSQVSTPKSSKVSTPKSSKVSTPKSSKVSTPKSQTSSSAAKKGRNVVTSPFTSGLKCVKLTERLFTSWRNGLLKKVKDYIDGAVYRVYTSGDMSILNAKQQTALKGLHTRFDQLGDIINAELGFAQDQEQRNLWKNSRTVYTFLSAGMAPSIIGLAVIDRHIPKGGKLILVEHVDADSSSKDQHVEEPSSSIHNVLNESMRSNVSSNMSLCVSDERSYRIDFGVHRIWTHPRYRGQKVATRLLDSIRLAEAVIRHQHQPISKKKFGFTDPTEAGKGLMGSYCQGLENVLIYSPF